MLYKILPFPFFYNNVHIFKQVLSLNFRERFYNLMRNRTIKITNKNINAFIGNRKYYFAYGANMDIDTIRKRCPSAERIGIGYKENYKLVFNRKGSYRKGGVSSIEPSYKNTVFGIIYSITEIDLIELDAIEDPTAYLREETLIKAFKNKDKTYKCQIYLSYRINDLPPDPEYLDLINRVG